MSESIADVRKRAWQTRRSKYGERGHAAPYSRPALVYNGTWNERLRKMENALIRLYVEGTLSEGQVSAMTGIDRVSCRDLALEMRKAMGIQ